LDTDYNSSISNRTATPGTGPYRNGATNATHYADFDQSLAPINSYYQGASAASGAYVARAGESLSSVAGALWGDGSLWYRLAEANGLSGNAALSEGQRLNVPTGVMKNTHNASTFTPYDPSEIIGDTAPTTPLQPVPSENLIWMRSGRSDDAIHRGLGVRRCDRGAPACAGSVHPCPEPDVCGRGCSSRHSSAARGRGGPR
jgi:hypothetical protein